MRFKFEFGVAMFLLFVFTFYYFIKVNYIYFGRASAIEVAKIAAEKKDPLICERVKVYWPFMSPPEISVRTECLFRVSDLLMDRSICERIRLISDSPNVENYIEMCKAQIP